MNNTSFDLLIAAASLIIGLMMVTGNGGIFMKGGDAKKRGIVYDEKKMEKSSGIAMILVGIATGVDAYTTSVAAKIVYILVLIVIFVVLLIYYRTKCKK